MGPFSIEKSRCGEGCEWKEDGTTFHDLMEFLKKRFKVELDAVYSGSYRLYDSFDTKVGFEVEIDWQDRENQNIIDVYKNVVKRELKPHEKYIEILAFCSPEGADDDLMADDIDLPSVFVEI